MTVFWAAEIVLQYAPHCPELSIPTCSHCQRSSVRGDVKDVEMHWEDAFRRIAERQDGVVGIDQLPELCSTGEHWRRAKANRRWVPLSRRVLRLAGHPTTDALRARAALLDAGGAAVLHAESGLAWCGIRGFDLSRIHVVRRRGTTSTPCELAVVHRLRDLDSTDLVQVRGLPVVSPVRAAWSIASALPPTWPLEWRERRIGRILDEAHKMGLVRWEHLQATVDRLAGRGRAASDVMRAVAAKRPAGSSVTESRNEDRLEEILDEAGTPVLERQVEVGGTGPIGRVDHRDPDLPMVVETNSLLFHSTPSDQDHDEQRYAALNGSGFTVVVVWEGALWSDTGSVVAAVAEGRRRARRKQPAVIHTTGCPWPFDPARIVIAPVPRPYRA